MNLNQPLILNDCHSGEFTIPFVTLIAWIHGLRLHIKLEGIHGKMGDTYVVGTIRDYLKAPEFADSSDMLKYLEDCRSDLEAQYADILDNQHVPIEYDNID